MEKETHTVVDDDTTGMPHL